MIQHCIFNFAKKVDAATGEIVDSKTNFMINEPRNVTQYDHIQFPNMSKHADDNSILLSDSITGHVYIVSRKEALDKGLRTPEYV